MEEAPQYLFVYGTLRPCLAGPEQKLITREFTLVGPATISGVLYDLKHYPGVQDGAGRISGDVLFFSNNELLRDIDAYEGCYDPPPLFLRKTTCATLESGKTLVAWVYYYCGSLVKASVITGGDYRVREE